ncbi:methyl-accepting chemotaxis protein [Chromobacterium sphagni]|uniref:Chemotaxis methyl-accepting receptor HlyB-like 4HB MCP domain-containing protein n=1 Tax=Chromobacterium sphagni TaxID=1903179 RepID=A0ABX3CD70_9NEIS|nr:methyl-accepting chemotaxis protein [Chromobacterium sphagni]OHX20184.1 hypothetical protein BI344_06670 [Chromobacterium sphagni]
MKNCTIQRQFIALTACLLLGLGILTATAWQGLRTVMINGAMYHQVVIGKDFINDLDPPTLELEASFLLVNQLRNSQDPSIRQQQLNQLQIQRDKFFDGLKKWGASDLPPEMRNILAQKVQPSGEAFYQEMDNHFLPALDAHDQLAINRSFDHLAAQYDLNHQAIQPLIEQTVRMQRQTEGEAQRITSQTFGWLAGVSLTVVLLLAGFLLQIYRQLIRRLGGEPHEVARFSREVAAGRLDIELGPAPPGSLSEAMQQMCLQLRAIIGEVKNSSNGIASAAQQISSTALALSQGPAPPPPACSKVRPRSSRCRRRSTRLATTPAPPRRLPKKPPTKPPRAGRRCNRRCWRCGKSLNGSASSTKSPTRPIFWR